MEKVKVVEELTKSDVVAKLRLLQKLEENHINDVNGKCNYPNSCEDVTGIYYLKLPLLVALEKFKAVEHLDTEEGIEELEDAACKNQDFEVSY